MSLTPQDFVAKWKRVTSRERQVYQEHFIDLCHLAGHPTPNEMDPTGKQFAFELGAGKTSGGQGWADVAKLGYFGWEYKGKDHDLNKAYEQLLMYRDALQNPPVLVVSDINQIIIRTNYTNMPTRTITLTLDDMLKAESLKVLRAVFFNPDELKPQITVAGVTEEAARQFSKLAGNLRKYGEEPQQIAHFLIRLIFCLFAEDVGLLPEKLFPRMLTQSKHHANIFAGMLRQLFQAMRGGGSFGADAILYFNGGLFDNDLVLELDGEAMDTIAGIDALDWGAIEPSIFGTLFERGLDPTNRSELGAHYTGKDDIVLVVEPVLMAPLRRQWQALQTECSELADQAQSLSEKKRAQEIAKLGGKLRDFADTLATIRVLDPACGSGNFLYVALQLLLDLQHEVINFSDALGAGRFFISVSPSQVFGIEKNEYAHELAQVTIWIGYIQWMLKNGYGLPSEPILKKMDNIQNMDAILAFDADGKPFEPDWPHADVIVGNPPFLGGSKFRRELGDEYTEKLWELYRDRLPSTADLVCYWFENARHLIETKKAKRVGLLSTNSIRDGFNRRVLERIKETGNIFMAWGDREWVLDGASVNISMVGFDDGTEQQKILDGKTVRSINSDLTTNFDLTKAYRLSENFGIAFSGTKKYGPFELDKLKAFEILNASGNPNGRPNSDVVKPWANGLNILRGNPDMWIIDFGVDTPFEYEKPFEYVLNHVKPERDKVRRDKTRRNWWLFEETRIGMRRAIAPLRRFIVTSMMAKHRVFVWMKHPTMPDQTLIVTARDDDYFLGLLSSRPHLLWALGLGSTMEDRPRYTHTSTFETFPFPWAPGSESLDDPRVQAIAAAAKELVEMRDRWLNPEGLSEAERKKRTLTNLYNARPTWLDLAHQRLDAAVFDAYGWPHDLSDEQILERLLALNLQRARKAV